MCYEKIENIYTEDDFPIEIDVPFHCEDDETDYAYFDILDIEYMKKINRLAAEFYSMYGYKFLPDMDFMNSSHPQEQACFTRACIAYYLIVDKAP